MIASIEGVANAADLLVFLYGPAGHKHDDGREIPRTIGGYPDQFLEPFLEPEPLHDGGWDASFLIRMLEPPAERAGKDYSAIWHCELRTSPREEILHDEQWADVALEVAIQNAVAIDDEYQASVAPWTAIRHAADHIHIVICLYGFEGQRLFLSRDRLKVAHACAMVEERLGLWSQRLRRLDEDG